MKRVFFLLSALTLCTIFAGTAMSAGNADGAALYKRCQGCHGADGTEAKKSSGHVLKGMSAEDAEEKLLAYQAGTIKSPKAMIMTRMVKRFSKEDIKALADHIGDF